MKFTTLLTTTLTTTTSLITASSFELCCCTKKDPSTGDTKCSHDATKTIVDTMHGHFDFTTFNWLGVKRGKPIYGGKDYIYATGKDGDDSRIGPKEMKGWCGKQEAGRYCWSPGSDFNYNYKGELIKTTPTGHA
ncbi:hypothetical protein EG328_006329 [Venturia inaequalis]|uniref:Uncharacterized protein n=1 Tax=Venturia inaequalis TaxID=5025 RepID=A0A8H3UIW1_VENIN|nr:hypothetical protein EG328_006329 [Venturia inaequalis]KAE9975203.1 hypothetical protein EG327_008516 [Venturia inaequalis]RDI83748.1 hypothetical protein Vi05172_g6325 [Venturia inaequalis]